MITSYEEKCLRRLEQIIRRYVEHQRTYDRPMTATECLAREEIYWLEKHRERIWNGSQEEAA